MQIMEIAVSGTLDGAYPLAQTDLSNSEVGRNIYTVTDLGYIDPFIAGSPNEVSEGVRLDLLHITQAIVAGAFICAVVDSQNNPILEDILDLSVALNLANLTRELVIPRGYRLRLQSDQAGPFSVKMGFNPLVSPVDFAITAIQAPPA